MEPAPTPSPAPTALQTREQDRLDDFARSRALRKEVAQGFFAGQFWFILKNVLGWVLMLLAGPIGVAVPGPGGIPIFLLGFALATIPGKRKMTSHVLRGRAIRVRGGVFVGIATTLSVLVVLGLLWFFQAKKAWLIQKLNLSGDSRGELVAWVVVVSIVAIGVTWVAIRLALAALNVFLRNLPKARRMVKPYLKKYGIHLLPRRRKLIDGKLEPVNDNEILEISADGQAKFKSAGQWLGRWGIRVAVIGGLLYALYIAGRLASLLRDQVTS